MSIGSLLFSAKGRIAPKTFWLSYGPIFIVTTGLSFVSRGDPTNQMMSILTGLIALLLLYPSTCINAKRLHDMGFSGWLQLIIYVVGIAFGILSPRAPSARPCKSPWPTRAIPPPPRPPFGKRP